MSQRDWHRELVVFNLQYFVCRSCDLQLFSSDCSVFTLAVVILNEPEVFDKELRRFEAKPLDTRYHPFLLYPGRCSHLFAKQTNRLVYVALAFYKKLSRPSNCQQTTLLFGMCCWIKMPKVSLILWVCWLHKACWHMLNAKNCGKSLFCLFAEVTIEATYSALMSSSLFCKMRQSVIRLWLLIEYCLSVICYI